jgi:hypothetical protein
MMSFDPVDREVVLFGGYPGSGYTYLGDTWTFANGTWTLLNLTTSPPARAAGGMAYDAPDRSVVLFGGGTAFSVFNDTWTFHGNHWTQQFPVLSPPARYRMGMASDRSDRGIVLFGGCGSVRCPDGAATWIYANHTWSNVTGPGGPSLRFDPALSADPKGGSVLLFGGCSVGGHCSLNDTWRFHSGHWARVTSVLSPVPPVGRELAMMAPGTNGSVVLFGGVTARHSDGDTWSFQKGVWINLTGALAVSPPPGSAGSLVWDPVDGVDVLFGASTASNETWEFDS